MKPSKVLDGVSYDTQNNFNNAWNAYNKSQTQPTTTGSTYNTTGTTSPTSYAPQGMTSTRDALGSYGIDNSRIGYNNGAVTVDGRYFGTPSANIGGTTYYDQTGFQNDLGKYRINDMQTQILNNTQLPENAYTAKIDDLMQQLRQSANTQSSIDPYSTPEYAAYQAQADRRAQAGTRAAQEALGSAGFGRSTALGERAQGIQNEQTEYLETQVIPMLLANERARKQQEYENMASLLNPLISQQGYIDQRSLQNLQNQYNALGMLTSEQQRGLDNRRADAAYTGTLLTPEQESLINSVLSLKQQAETKGITKDQRNTLSQQANQLRDRMRATGLDPTQYGANVNFNNASQNTPGRTIQGQQLDMESQGQQFNQGMQTRQQNFMEKQTGVENKFRDRQQTFDEGQTQWENDFKSTQQAWQNSFDSARFEEDKRQFGINSAIDKQAQKLREDQFTYDKETDKQTKKDMEAAYKSELADMILSQNLSDEDTKALLKKYGITDAMIQEYMSGPGNL
jgi:hypothetical protein